MSNSTCLCQDIMSYAPFGSIPLFGLFNILVLAVSVVVVLGTLSSQYEASYKESLLPLHRLLQNGQEATRLPPSILPPRSALKRRKRTISVLPCYHTFSVLACLSLLCQCLAFAAPAVSDGARRVAVYISAVTCTIPEALFTIHLLRSPTATARGTVVLAAAAVATLALVILAALPGALVPASCTYCGVHFPKPGIQYVWVVLGGMFGYFAICSEFGRHPLLPWAVASGGGLPQSPWGVRHMLQHRPALAAYGAFLCLPYTVSGMGIFLIGHDPPAAHATGDPHAVMGPRGSPIGGDPRAVGYCMLVSATVFYSLLMAPMLLRTMVLDSTFCRQEMMQLALRLHHGFQPESTAPAAPAARVPAPAAQPTRPQYRSAQTPSSVSFSLPPGTAPSRSATGNAKADGESGWSFLGGDLDESALQVFGASGTRDLTSKALGKLLAIPSLNLIAPSSLRSLRRCGSGGFGDVYSASWQGLPVAIKQLRLELHREDSLQVLARSSTRYVVSSEQYVVRGT